MAMDGLLTALKALHYGGKVLAALVEPGKGNTAAATAEFQDQVNEIALLTDARRTVVDEEHWRAEPEHMKPTIEDVAIGLAKFGNAYSQAGNPGKKKMLFNAFFSAYKPQFFKDGMGAHLWRIARDLEYPELRYLADRLRWEAELREGKNPMTPTVARGSKEEFFTKRLIDAAWLSSTQQTPG